MNIIVCGGRTFMNRHIAFKALDQVLVEHPEITRLYEGGARGADYLAACWAKARQFPHQEVRINSAIDGYDTNAPINRNIRMFEVASPGLVVGFPGGRGTLHMMTYAHDRGAIVLDIETGVDSYEITQWPAKK